MQITLETKPYAGLTTDALVTYVFEEPDPVQGRIAEIDKSASGLLARLAKSGELTGKPLEMTLVHAPAGLAAARLLLVGAGKRERFDGATLRKVAGAAFRYLKSRGVKQIAFVVRESDVTEDAAQTVAEGALAADFETDKYKTDKKNDKGVDTLLLAGYSDKERAAAEKGVSRGRGSALGDRWTDVSGTLTLPTIQTVGEGPLKARKSHLF
jgi:leucyl aminopeptidase